VIIARHAAKSAAERAIGARLDQEAVDNVLQNHYQVLPSRQQIYGVVGTWRFRKHSNQLREHFRAAPGTTTDDHDNAVWMNRPRLVGRPRTAPELGPREEKALHNRMEWDRVKKTQPREIDDRAWRILKLRYGQRAEFPEIAKALKTSEANARQILSRATRTAVELGMRFK